MSDVREQATIRTYDENAEAWAAQHDFAPEDNAFTDALNEFYELVPSGSSVLEIGCGGGREAVELVKRYVYLGTDASRGMINAAKTNVPNATFEQCNVYDLGVLDSTFDAFWAVAVLLHIPRERIDEALQSLKAVTVSNAVGMIAIKDGNGEDFEVRDVDGVHEERLFTYWTKEDFDKVLDRNDIAVISYNFKPISQRTNWHIYLTRNQNSSLNQACA